ncbi:hypothetical protein [Luteolibacter sp. LG18]|uniref:hypothetical protein n=1 Tax=Luteolibacter sp. LG18 TaxID=2819286 RepID=UPI0030C6C95C
MLILLAHLVVLVWMDIRLRKDLSESLGARRSGWMWFGDGRAVVSALAAINRLRDRRIEECPLCYRRKVEGFTSCSCGAPYGSATDPRLIAVLRARCARGQGLKCGLELPSKSGGKGFRRWPAGWGNSPE